MGRELKTDLHKQPSTVNCSPKCIENKLKKKKNFSSVEKTVTKVIFLKLIIKRKLNVIPEIIFSCSVCEKHVKCQKIVPTHLPTTTTTTKSKLYYYITINVGYEMMQ